MSATARRRTVLWGGWVFAALLCLVLSAACLLPASPAFAAQEVADSQEQATPTTIADLLAADTTLEAQQVSFSGEAVGSSYIAEDPGHRWVNLSDADGNTIGVYMTAAQAAQVTTYGRYNVTGSTLAVTGVYHTACNDGHAGELDVHASTVEETAAGETGVSRPVSGAEWAIAILMLVAGAVLFIADRGYQRWKLH